jgi:phenylalanyl-tRNA synthetase alpha chain
LHLRGVCRYPIMDIESVNRTLETDAGKIDSAEKLEEFRVKYLGRKGIFAELTGSIPALPPEQRGVFGKTVNGLKLRALAIIAEKEKTASVVKHEAAEKVDLSLPGISQTTGRKHPITLVTEEICAIFEKMGFGIVEGPEIETEFNNFTGLNIPLEHPSREAFDTFYLKENNVAGERLLLRSQTSPVQIRVMKTRKPPLAVVCPGKVYRPDAVDACHSFMFHQIEGFMVDNDIRFSHLKGVLEHFAREVFGPDTRMRFRPHFFPFTEPSAEIDIACFICGGKGCPACGRKGWLEILGSGMIHPNVFKNVGYDPDKYSGFAFGMGVERIAMLKYRVTDIRLFYENDRRFLNQF